MCRLVAKDRGYVACRALEPRAQAAQLGHKDIIHNKLNQILSTNLQSVDEDSNRDLLEEVPLENFQGLASFGRAVYEVSCSCVTKDPQKLPLHTSHNGRLLVSALSFAENEGSLLGIFTEYIRRPQEKV